MEIKKIVPAKRLNISLSTGILIRKIGRDSNANIIGLIQFANGYERMVLNFIVVNCHYSIQRPRICAVGSFIYSSPPATAAERRTKIRILFKS